MLARHNFRLTTPGHPNMMPLAPTPIVAVPSKPKIGFSIDSIVGGASQGSPQHSPIHYSESSAPPFSSPQRSPVGSPKPPIMVPGIPAHTLVRPNPTYDPNLVPKNGFLQPEMIHNHGQHPFALAAHFQGAALAAALSSGQHGFPGQPSPLAQHTQPRDSYPLYPWLLSRHGRIFPHRFPGGWFVVKQSILPLILIPHSLQNYLGFDFYAFSYNSIPNTIIAAIDLTFACRTSRILRSAARKRRPAIRALFSPRNDYAIKVLISRLKPNNSGTSRSLSTKILRNHRLLIRALTRGGFRHGLDGMLPRTPFNKENIPRRVNKLDLMIL
ncbi:hypothetical protein NQ318_005118 [Aromia moschata]|uniref:Uncharacterized protein n=1 Tax=Aromia moschata TaxID=1265417 RepID=A0AAV8XTC9_9CUCU|nr:hypothetical protein NQ318_005118 [Aromia moschata]